MMRPSRMGVRIPRILAAVYGQPWAITPSTLSAIKRAVDLYAVDKVAYMEPGEDEDEEEETEVLGGVAILNVSGIIGAHLSSLEMECGGCDVTTLPGALHDLEADARVGSVLMVMRTPGGTITGVPEAAQAVASFSKPIVAYTDSMSASAGYWIASQANEIWMSPSAEVGSIGVYAAVVDESAAWAKDGYKLELMKAGKHKAAGIPGIPLSDDDRAMMQADVDRWYKRFTDTVLAGRPAVSIESMQGQMFDADNALALGLADRIVGSYQEAAEMLSRK